MPMVTIAGRPVQYELSGRDGPVVVLETGLGAESSAWSGVVQSLDPDHRVLTYDRPGRGGSNPLGHTRDATEIAADLHDLLTEAALAPPYIFVGQSFGGMIGRMFADSFPEDVSLLVMVESMHRDQFARIEHLFPEPSDGEPAQLSSMRDFWQEGWRDPMNNPERIDFRRSFRQDAHITSLGDLPVAVITAEDFRSSAFLPADRRERMQAVWNELQLDLAGLSRDAARIPAKGSGHFVQRDRPAMIAECVRATGSGPGRLLSGRERPPVRTAANGAAASPDV